MRRTARQFAAFCLVGVSNTAIDFLVYFILTRYLGFVGDLLFAAKVISYLIAVLNSFLLNRYWTFAATSAFTWSELAKFYVTAGSGILINLTVHYINVQLLSIDDVVSLLVAALLTAGWGYAMSRRFVFNQ